MSVRAFADVAPEPPPGQGGCAAHLDAEDLVAAVMLVLAFLPGLFLVRRRPK